MKSKGTESFYVLLSYCCLIILLASSFQNCFIKSIVDWGLFTVKLFLVLFGIEHCLIWDEVLDSWYEKVLRLRID